MNVADEIIAALFGRKNFQATGGGKNIEYDTPGIFKKYIDIGQKANWADPMLTPVNIDYNKKPEQSPYTPNVQGTQDQYSPPPTLPTAQPDVQQNVQQGVQPEKDPYSFPLGDKPPVPKEYHETLNGIKNANVVASVLAQETGGYGYGLIDPDTGKTTTDWVSIKGKNIRGPAGEVGIAQIVPKWHFKAAGFPDEESYAQALYDPTFSIQEAGRIINHAFDIYGDWRKALNSWNKAPNYPDEIMGRIGVPLGGE